MRIIFLTTDLSFPPQDGRMLRTYNVLRGLSTRHTVHLVCFDQRHGVDPLQRRRLAESTLRELCESVDVFEIPSKRSQSALAMTGIASLLSRQPFSSRVYRSPASVRTLQALASANPVDLIHVENTLLGDHVAQVPSAARVLVHHNVESDLFAQRAASDRHFLRRAFLGLEARKMRAFERRMGPRFGVHIACSAGDAATLSTIMAGVRVCVVPNGVDLEHFSLPDQPHRESLEVVHIGGLNWTPNLLGVEWLIEKVWPHVRTAVPSARLTLVGRSGDAPVAQWQAVNGVNCIGEVPDVRPFFAGAAVSVVPVHVGGGTRLKILNAWAMGTPVVSTTKGCEGLPGRNEEHLLVADTPALFGEAIARLLRQPDLRKALAASGRRLVETEFGWPRIVDRTEEAYGLARAAGAR
jgi:glycosyltransferase involved in cell wall biosynthesis